EHILADQAPFPVGLAVAARADGEIERGFSGRRLRLDRGKAAFGIDRTAVFYSHGNTPERAFLLPVPGNDCHRAAVARRGPSAACLPCRRAGVLVEGGR